MPKLGDFRKIITLELPGYPESKVEVYDSVLVRDLGDTPLIDEKSTVKDMLKSLPKLIKSWNFTDDKDQPLPINENSLGLLNVDALKFLVESISVTSKEVKKN